MAANNNAVFIWPGLFSVSGGTITFLGQMAGPAADNTAAPPYTFLGDLTSGYASSAVGTLALVTAGTTRLSLNATAATSTVPLTINQPGIATTSTDGQVLQNATAATSGVPVQYSPRSRWCGTAYNSVSMLSETDCVIAELQPSTVAGATSAALVFSAALAGSSSYTEKARLSLGSGSFTVANVGNFSWSGRSNINSSADGVITVTNNAGTDFSRLNFGGTTSSFPAWNRAGSFFEARTADGSSFTGITMSQTNFTSSLAHTNVILISGTAPTIASGFGTSPAIAASNGTAAFLITIGSGGTDSSGVLTLPTATTGWIVMANDMTTPGVNATKQTASSTTSATLTNYNTTTGIAAAWTAGDTIRCIAMAY